MKVVGCSGIVAAAGISIFLGVVVGIIILGGIGYLIARAKLREFSQDVFGTDSIRQGINQAAVEASRRPKSVSSMTRILEPQILKDFPEFSWPEFRHKAENMLTSALVAITSEDSGKLVEASDDVHRQIAARIDGNRAEGVREHFGDIHIHQTEISNYRKEKGSCVITIQSAVQYYHYKERDGKLVEGSKELLHQAKYNSQLVYIQDASLVGETAAVGVTCPNCGAPVKMLGTKFCEYCGSGLTVVNTRVWSLHKLEEVDYNHV